MGRGGFGALAAGEGRALAFGQAVSWRFGRELLGLGNYLGGNEEGSGWWSGGLQPPGMQGAFSCFQLGNPTGGGEVGCQWAECWLRLPPYLWQGGCHAQPWPCCCSLGTCSRLGAGEDPSWRKLSVVGKETSGLLCGPTGGTCAGEAAAGADLTQSQRHSARAGAGLAAGASQSPV